MAEAASPASPIAPDQGEGPIVITRGHYLGWVAMITGMFLAILDIQIVASSLQQIQSGLAASPDEISWIQTSYLIAEVVMIPLSGYLARVFSTRKLFIISALGFTLSSAACAMAWSIESLIVFRVIQGFLGGAMIPTVFSATFIVFSNKHQTSANVVVGLIATLAPTIGPTLGGWITESFSWHWLFLINIIPGLIVVSMVFAMPTLDREDRSLLKGFDLTGLLLMAAFLGSLEFILDEGPKEDWFDDPLILYFTIVAVVAAALFLRRMLRYFNPIVDIRAFSNRNFALGCLYSFIIGVGLYGCTYLAPLYLFQVRGYSALQIGHVMMVTGAFQFMSAPVAGALSTRLDQRVMLGIGLSLFAVGTYLNGHATADWSLHELFWPQAIRGFALMFLFIPINDLALGTLAPDQLKNASGLYNLMRNLGGAIGIAALNTLLDHRHDLHLARLADRLDPSNPTFQAMLEGLSARLGDMMSGNPEQAAVKIMGMMAEREATVMAFNDAYLAVSCIFAAALLLTPFAKKPAHKAPGGGH